MKNLYYSDLSTEGKKIFKIYCATNVSSFKMQNYFSGKLPIPQEEFKEWVLNEFLCVPGMLRVIDYLFK